MKNSSKYKRQYFLPPVKCMDWAEKDYVEKGFSYVINHYCNCGRWFTCKQKSKAVIKNILKLLKL